MLQIRNSYNNILKKYQDLGKGNVRLTQSTLLLVQPINAATDTYKFPVLETDNAIAPQPEEIRLNMNDEFISYDIGYYVMCNMDKADVDAGRFFLTYAPMELHHSFTGILGAWLGKLAISVNNIQRVEKWDLKRHNIIPRTQFQNTSAGIPAATQPSLKYEADGMFPMQPMLVFSGAKKNDITLNLVAAISATAGGDWTTGATAITFEARKLALLFRGLLAQNAAKFQGA